jgi:CheY-like chemotaxis protein
MKTQLTVLLAEDEEDDVFFLKRALNKSRITDPLHVVNDGEHAVDYIRGERDYGNRRRHPMPDIMIVDLKMPGKSGFEVLNWLRRESRCRSMPLIILSSSPEPRDIARAYEFGANAYLVKSSDMDHFSAILKDLYEFWKQTAELP